MESPNDESGREGRRQYRALLAQQLQQSHGSSEALVDALKRVRGGVEGAKE